MEEERLRAIVESMLFAAGEPVSLTQLANALDSVPREEIRKTLTEMMRTYADGARGITLEEIAGGYQLRTPREYASYVRRLLAAKPPRLSRPLLETLAIIAYRQPITRPEIEQLRGVDSGGVLDTLSERDLIKIAGRKEAPGRPIMYATTAAFLEVFGLKDLDSLPDLEEFRALEMPRELESDAQSKDSAPAAEQLSEQPLESAGGDAVFHSPSPAEAAPASESESAAPDVQAPDVGAPDMKQPTSVRETAIAGDRERDDTAHVATISEDARRRDVAALRQPENAPDDQLAASDHSREGDEDKS